MADDNSSVVPKASNMGSLLGLRSPLNKPEVPTVSSTSRVLPVLNLSFFILIPKDWLKKFLNLFDSWRHFSFILCLKVL
jgi:hypothetical protein